MCGPRPYPIPCVPYPLAWQTPADIQRAIKAREALLVPVFTQIAHSFADLHDTPGRMLAKGCIDRVVPWRTARRELFLRLRRRLVGHCGSATLSGFGGVVALLA